MVKCEFLLLGEFNDVKNSRIMFVFQTESLILVLSIIYLKNKPVKKAMRRITCDFFFSKIKFERNNYLFAWSYSKCLLIFYTSVTFLMRLEINKKLSLNNKLDKKYTKNVSIVLIKT